MQWLEVVLAILACYRLARLISIDVGPYEVFERFRKACGRRAGESAFWHTLAEGVHCPHCVGVWIAFVLAIFLCNSLFGFFLLWFGIAGGQEFLEVMVAQREEPIKR